MDCKHAYFKNGIKYVLCDCGGDPKNNKLDEITKHMCGYQRFCPNARACALMPEWVNCSKLRMAEAKTESVAPSVTRAKQKRKSQD